MGILHATLAFFQTGATTNPHKQGCLGIKYEDILKETLQL